MEHYNKVILEKEIGLDLYEKYRQEAQASLMNVDRKRKKLRDDDDTVDTEGNLVIRFKLSRVLPNLEKKVEPEANSLTNNHDLINLIDLQIVLIV